MDLIFYNPRIDLERNVVIKKWWKDHCEVPFELELLSDHAYMAYKVDKPIAALFLYRIKGCAVCWIGWPVTNKDTTKKERNLALGILFDKLHADAKALEYKLVWTISGVAPIKRRLDKLGYIVGDENVSQYWKGL